MSISEIELQGFGEISGFVSILPSEIGLFSAEVAVGGGLGVAAAPPRPRGRSRAAARSRACPP